MKKHPGAVLLPVSALKDKPKLVYCWIVDKSDTLNNFMIRNGCYPGGTMLSPKSNMVEMLMGEKTYDLFIEQIRSAEIYAKSKKLGIWSKEYPLE